METIESLTEEIDRITPSVYALAAKEEKTREDVAELYHFLDLQLRRDILSAYGLQEMVSKFVNKAFREGDEDTEIADFYYFQDMLLRRELLKAYELQKLTSKFVNKVINGDRDL